jgi:hypothetical protein
MVGDLPQPDRNRRDEMPGLNYKMIAVMVVNLGYFKGVGNRWDHNAGDWLYEEIRAATALDVVMYTETILEIM